MCNPIVSLVSSSAFAAPAVAPVSAELIGELLVALGLMSYDETTDLYDWRTDTALGRQYYTEDIFGNVVPKLKEGNGVTKEDLAPLYGSVIPEDVYETDGTDFYVKGNKLTTSDLFLSAKALVGVSYLMPTNISGAQYRSGMTYDYKLFTCAFSSSGIAESLYYIPYYVTADSAFIYPTAVCFTSKNKFTAFNLTNGKTYSGSTLCDNKKFLCFSANFPMEKGHAPFSMSDYSSPKSGQFFTSVGNVFNIENVICLSGMTDFTLSYDEITSASCLTTKGEPIMSIDANKVNLEKAVVKVEPSDDDDDNNGGLAPVPPSPNNWQIWKTAEDLLDFVDTGESTNGGTMFQDYVNNDYNYIDVDINMPDKVDTNVNLSGGLDVNGKGDINVTIHEDVSLPTGGDGSGFYNPDAVDAIAALTTNNPAVQVIKGLFEAIDPALVGIFSVGVSLLVVLGLWKLIRG